MNAAKRCFALAAIAACALGTAPTVDAQEMVASKVNAERASLAPLRRTRDALIAVSELDAALERAAEIVAAAETRGDGGLADDLLQLALIQTSLEEHAAAELNYLRAIELKQHAQGVFSPALIEPLHALGRSYIDSGRFKDALTVLANARSISQRTFGLFNLEQMALIDEMTRAYVEAGDKASAHALQLERLHKAIRHFGADAPELVPFYRHLGDYYYQHLGDLYGNLPSNFRAHDQYWKAFEIASAGERGDASPESLALLRRLTAVEMHIDDRPRAPDRLLAALDHPAGIGAAERGMSFAALGDWATVKGDHASAERYYSAAFGAFGESADLDAEALFATPVMLDFVPPPDGIDAGGPLPLWTWGTLELAIDVSATGQATDVRTVFAEPAGTDLERAYLQRVRKAHFRPSLEKGRPVAMTGVRSTHRFRYYARD